LREEIAHSATHGLGIVLSIAGLIAMIVVSERSGDVRHVVASIVYGATLILLYLSSTLYHGIPSPNAKRVLKVLDHSAIYLLIAGTYTPFTLISLRGGWAGPCSGSSGYGAARHHPQIAAIGRFQWLSIALYLAWAGWWWWRSSR